MRRLSAYAREMDLVDKLERAIRTHILLDMPVDRTGTLAHLSLRSLLHEYGAWRSRIPAPVPRGLHVSRQLLQSTAVDTYGCGLRAVVEDLAFGRSVRSRLSTDVLHGYEPAVPRALEARPRRRRDRDPLLSDWGIHHLHLSTTRGRHPDFVRRTRDVLLVAFRGPNAYLLDVRPHEGHGANWAAKDIVEIAIRNWPEANIFCRLEYAIGLTNADISDDDRRALRAAGVNTGLEIDGNVYMPPNGGQTADGAPVYVAGNAMRVQAIINDLRRTPGGPEAFLADRAAFYRVARALWRGLVHEDEFGYFNSGAFVPYGRLVTG